MDEITTRRILCTALRKYEDMKIVGIVGCIFKNDYNSVIGLGLLFLLSKHYNIANIKSVHTSITKIFILVVFTILVDIFQIIVVTDQPVFPRFVITVIEIVCKIGILLGMKGSTGSDNRNK